MKMFQDAKDEKKTKTMEPELKKSRTETKHAPEEINKRSAASQPLYSIDNAHHTHSSSTGMDSRSSVFVPQFSTLHFTSQQSGLTATGDVGPAGCVGSTSVAGSYGLIHGTTMCANYEFYSQNYLRYCPENTDHEGNLIETNHSCQRCSIYNSLNSQTNLNKEVWEWKKKHDTLEQTSRFVIAMVLLESWCLPELLFNEMSKDLRLLLLYPT